MDYLRIYEKFSDVKEVADYINDVDTLRQYYYRQQFTQMQEHIRTIVQKYFVESMVWNTVNRDTPKTYAQAYINAENFLQAHGAAIIVKKVKEYRQRLNAEEIAFIESMIKPME